MLLLLIAYFIYLILYAVISYAIAFHLIRYRVHGDQTQAILSGYIAISALIILGSFVFLATGFPR